GRAHLPERARVSERTALGRTHRCTRGGEAWPHGQPHHWRSGHPAARTPRRLGLRQGRQVTVTQPRAPAIAKKTACRRGGTPLDQCTSMVIGGPSTRRPSSQVTVLTGVRVTVPFTSLVATRVRSSRCSGGNQTAPSGSTIQRKVSATCGSTSGGGR